MIHFLWKESFFDQLYFWDLKGRILSLSRKTQNTIRNFLAICEWIVVNFPDSLSKFYRVFYAYIFMICIIERMHNICAGTYVFKNSEVFHFEDCLLDCCYYFWQLLYCFTFCPLRNRTRSFFPIHMSKSSLRSYALLF